MIKRMVIMLALVGAVLGAFFWFQGFKATMIKKFMAAAASPPQTVSTTTAGVQEWQPEIEAVGSLRAVNGADLAFEVSGIVKDIQFNSGDDVAAGKEFRRRFAVLPSDHLELSALRAPRARRRKRHVVTAGEHSSQLPVANARAGHASREWLVIEDQDRAQSRGAPNRTSSPWTWNSQRENRRKCGSG